jgi:hypothetical protein
MRNINVCKGIRTGIKRYRYQYRIHLAACDASM